MLADFKYSNMMYTENANTENLRAILDIVVRITSRVVGLLIESVAFGLNLTQPGGIFCVHVMFVWEETVAVV